MIVLDMDGVLVDFCRAAYEIHGKPYDGNEPTTWNFFEGWGINEDQFWSKIDACKESFWSELREYHWARELIYTIDEVDHFVIATKCSTSPYSSFGKVLSLQRLFGEDFRDYFITPRKELLAGPGRILIDDSDSNCTAFEDAGGAAILFPQPWNKNRDKLNIPPITYVLEKLEACYERV